MASYGVTVVRMWAFSLETWHGFEPSLGQYNNPEFLLFDYVALSAKKHQIKLIVTLENYWADYGGITGRLKWFGVNPQPNQGVFFHIRNCHSKLFELCEIFYHKTKSL